MLVPTIVLVSDGVAAYLLGTQFAVSLLYFLFVIVIVLKTLKPDLKVLSLKEKNKMCIFVAVHKNIVG